MEDKAGNYLFEVDGVNYRIMKMDVFQQREFIGVMKGAFDSEGNIDIFSDASNKAQDWLFPRIYHEDDSQWKPLKLDYLSIYLNKQSQKPLPLMNQIYITAAMVLFENFTGTGEGPESANSNPQPAANTENSNSETSGLQKIWEESHQT